MCDRRAYRVMCWGETGDEGLDMLTAVLFVCERSCGLSGLAVTIASLSLPFSLCVGVWEWLGASAPQSSSSAVCASVFLHTQPPSL